MKFLEVIGGWINRYFSNEEAIFLAIALAVSWLVVATLGTVLAPILTGFAFAFLLHRPVARLVAWRVPRLLAICLVELLFIGALVALLVGILPLVWAQLGALLSALPRFVEPLREVATELAASYPFLFTESAVEEWTATLGQQATLIGGAAVQGLVGQLPNVLGLLIFLVLTPIALFFFLKDADHLLGALKALLPRRRGVLDRIAADMAVQIGNYLRGKVIEIVIVAVATYVALALLGVQYAALLALLVGLSVLIPYVGAAVVTIPVAAVGLVQFGWTLDFLTLMIVYGVIQALDGNVLVPLLFSRAVDLHPIAIIVAVLVFGGIWGVWGVFFAIPLATLVKAIHHAWPKQEAGVVASAGDAPEKA